MKTITLKTEDPSKYLSVLMLTDDWNVLLETECTQIKNTSTNQSYSFLDLKKEEAVLFESVENIPADWNCRSYYYFPDQNNWLQVHIEQQINTEDETNDTSIA